MTESALETARLDAIRDLALDEVMEAASELSDRSRRDDCGPVDAPLARLILAVMRLPTSAYPPGLINTQPPEPDDETSVDED